MCSIGWQSDERGASGRSQGKARGPHAPAAINSVRVGTIGLETAQHTAKAPAALDSVRPLRSFGCGACRSAPASIAAAPSSPTHRTARHGAFPSPASCAPRPSRDSLCSTRVLSFAPASLTRASACGARPSHERSRRRATATCHVADSRRDAPGIGPPCSPESLAGWEWKGPRLSGNPGPVSTAATAGSEERSAVRGSREPRGLPRSSPRATKRLSRYNHNFLKTLTEPNSISRKTIYRQISTKFSKTSCPRSVCETSGCHWTP